MHSKIPHSVIYFRLIVHFRISHCYENIHECSNGATSHDDPTIAASHSLIAIAIELQQEIQNTLDSNPLLEVSDDDHNDPATTNSNTVESISDNHQQDDYETEAAATLDINTNTDIPDIYP